MGNRAVITTRKNFTNNGVGVYLHWNGGRDSVESFLKYCELKGYCSPEADSYGWARLCQVIGNFFGGSTSVGIDTVDHLDCDNGDNGVYLIGGWKIVGRKFFNDVEQSEYSLDEMLLAIDECMPKDEQIGKAFLQAPVIAPTDMRYGDIISYIAWNGEVVSGQVVGFGGVGEIRNGHEVEGIPYLNLYDHDGDFSWNINNYCTGEFGREYRKL